MSLNRVDLTALIEEMRSLDVEIQGLALQEAARVTRVLMAEGANAFVKAPVPLVAADQLAMFGSLVPLLREIVESQDTGSETKAFGATLLLHFGSTAGVPLLLTMLRNREGPVVHIAIWLGKAGVMESRGILGELLNEWDFREDLPSGLSLVNSWKKLGGELSENLKATILGQVDEPFRNAVLMSIEAEAR